MPTKPTKKTTNSHSQIQESTPKPEIVPVEEPMLQVVQDGSKVHATIDVAQVVQYAGMMIAGAIVSALQSKNSGGK